MDNKNIIIGIFVFVFVFAILKIIPNHPYKDVNAFIKMINQKRDAQNYLSYTWDCKFLGELQYSMQVYEHENNYRFDAGQEVLLSTPKGAYIYNQKTHSTRKLKADDPDNKWVDILNISSTKYFHKRYVTIGKKTKVGQYECIQTKFKPDGPVYDVCLSPEYGLPILIKHKYENLKIMNCQIKNISTNELDNDLFRKF